MRYKGKVVTKAEILRNVWDAHHDGPDNVVEVYVGYVRRKIDVPLGTNTIEAIALQRRATDRHQSKRWLDSLTAMRRKPDAEERRRDLC